MLEKALYISYMAHRDQEDLNGELYFLHCVRVMERVRSYGEEYMCLALFHDAIEDDKAAISSDKVLFLITGSHPYPVMKLSADLVEALNAITRRDYEDYFDYIERVSKNEMALKVKLADLEDNLDPDRIVDWGGKHDLHSRYMKARKLLEIAEVKMEEEHARSANLG